MVDAVVNKAAELFLVVADASGAEVTRDRIGVVEPGRRSVSFDLDRPGGTPLAPGRYSVELRAVDEHGTQSGAPVGMEIRPLRISSGPPKSLLEATPAPAGRGLGFVLGAAAGALVGLAIGRRSGAGR